MNTTKFFVLVPLLCANLAFGHGDDDPLLSKYIIDKLEFRQDHVRSLESEAWIGKDLHKVWFKADVETGDGETESAEIQALSSHAIAANWDIQFGLRHDFELDDGDEQNWGVIGLRGLAPYFFDVDTALYIGDGGSTAWRLEAEYELLLSQRWVLIPEISLNVYGQNNDLRQTGSGLSDVEFGLRLAYHLSREIAPYIGYNRERLFGNSADYAQANGEGSQESSWVAGFKLWF